MKMKAAVADAVAAPNTKTPTVVVAVTTANVAREKGTVNVTTRMTKADVAAVTIMARRRPTRISTIRNSTSIFRNRRSL